MRLLLLQLPRRRWQSADIRTPRPETRSSWVACLRSATHRQWSRGSQEVATYRAALAALCLLHRYLLVAFCGDFWHRRVCSTLPICYLICYRWGWLSNSSFQVLQQPSLAVHWRPDRQCWKQAVNLYRQILLMPVSITVDWHCMQNANDGH